jgi:hypothetical protein
MVGAEALETWGVLSLANVVLVVLLSQQEIRGSSQNERRERDDGEPDPDHGEPDPDRGNCPLSVHRLVFPLTEFSPATVTLAAGKLYLKVIT